jgi:tetratricopeptide (TPR) repeat protein
MSDDIKLSKVNILIRQKKFAEAERIVKDLLSQDVNNTDFLSLLAEINLQQDKFDVAETLISNAIGIAPDDPHLFYIRSRIAVQQDKFDEAENDLRTAITLDPFDADYFAFLANIRLSRKNYAEALEYADKALSMDAENLLALNTRSSALLKLNRKTESFDTIEGALRGQPNNAFTHANYGWGLLEKGDHKKAKEHFREALKNDPNLDFAQAGMLEALKASNPVYRLFLKYSFFMGNLTEKYQWGVIIGFYVGMRGLRLLAANNAALQPYLIPLIVALAVIAFSTWVINPIGNLFLRFNSYGKFLLNKKEVMSSNFVAGSFALFLVGAGMYLIFSDERFLAITVFGFAMMLPFGVMFNPTKHKNALLIYSAVMAFVGLAAIALTFYTGMLVNTLSMIFLIGFVAFQWVANFMMIKEDNR